MRKQLILGSVAAAIVASMGWLALPQGSNGGFALENKSEEGEGSKHAQIAKEAMEWRMERLKDEDGNFYMSYYTNAVKQANAMKANNSNRAGSLNLQWEELGPDNVGGRTRAILVDKRDPTRQTVYAGGVGGGMWKSTDGANTWMRLANWNQWLAVSCIDQGPGPNYEIFIGTGEGLAQIGGSSFNSGTMGNGIFKLDANDNPVQITPDLFTANSIQGNEVWSAVNRIAVNPANELNIIAATGKGLYKTDDGGTTWSEISISGVSNGLAAADVKWSADGVNIFASVGGTFSSKVVRSLNGGFTWTKLSSTTSPGLPGTQGRVEIAIAPSNSNIVYLSVSTSSGATYGVYRTEDAGENWVNIGAKGPLFDPFGSNAQGWYDNVIAVNPFNPNKVYLGGVDFYTWSDQSGWKLADAGLGSGNANPNYIHPDKHEITFSDLDSNVMYVGCDGGVYKSVNAAASFPYPSFSVKNRGYNVTQMYSVAAGINGDVMGGAQDNGTNFINYNGNTRLAAKQVIGGDGIYADISHIDPRLYFGGIYFGQVLRSGNSTSSFDNFYDSKIDPQGFTQPSRCGGQKDQNAQFITPFYLGETRNAANAINSTQFKPTDRNYTAGETVTVESKVGKYKFSYTLPVDVAVNTSYDVPDPIRSRMFVSSNCGVWVTPDALELGNIPRWFKLINGMSGLPASYSQSGDGDVLYVGTTGGRVYRFGGLNARCDTTTYPIGQNAIGLLYTNASQYSSTVVASGRNVEGVSVDPNNPDHVVAVIAGFSNASQPHVYESNDGGATWTPLTNGLPNMPVYDVVIHDANTIIIGSELGVWSWDGTTWSEENNGFPRVPVYRLIEKELYQESCKVLYVGTHGRGMWRSTTLTDGSCNLSTGIENIPYASNTELDGLTIFPNPVNAGSKVSLTLSKADDVTFRIFDMTGKLYKEVTYKNAVQGENLFNLSASGLGAGTYLLSATLRNSRSQSKLFTVTK